MRGLLSTKSRNSKHSRCHYEKKCSLGRPRPDGRPSLLNILSLRLVQWREVPEDATVADVDMLAVESFETEVFDHIFVASVGGSKMTGLHLLFHFRFSDEVETRAIGGRKVNLVGVIEFVARRGHAAGEEVDGFEREERRAGRGHLFDLRGDPLVLRPMRNAAETIEIAAETECSDREGYRDRPRGPGELREAGTYGIQAGGGENCEVRDGEQEVLRKGRAREADLYRERHGEPRAQVELRLYFSCPGASARDVEEAEHREQPQYERWRGIDPGEEHFEIVPERFWPVDFAKRCVVLDHVEPRFARSAGEEVEHRRKRNHDGRYERGGLCRPSAVAIIHPYP